MKPLINSKSFLSHGLFVITMVLILCFDCATALASDEAVLMSPNMIDEAILTYFSMNNYRLSHDLFEHAANSSAPYYAGEFTWLCAIQPAYHEDSIITHFHPLIREKFSEAKEKGEATLSGSTAFESGDLYYALHKCDYDIEITYAGEKKQYEIYIVLRDYYDFESTNYSDFLTAVAVNYSSFMQAIGHLHEFRVLIGVHYTWDIADDSSDQTAVPDKEPNPGTVSNQTQTVSQHYWGSDYNEGWYDGEWRNGKPNGWGRLTYDGFDDGKYYSLNFSDGSQCKAIYYEGYFSDGFRNGAGTVAYEGGWREEGTFYGAWAPGKVVFSGKLWKGTDGYWPLTTTAISYTESSGSFGNWHSTVSLSVASSTDADCYCTIPANYTLHLYDSATATGATWVIAAQEKPYTLLCVTKYILSDNTVRYSYKGSDGTEYYFAYMRDFSLKPVENRPSPPPSLSVTSVSAANCLCTIPANYTLHLYDSAAAKDSGWNIGPQKDAYQLSCARKYTLSDGSVRYCYLDGKNEWYFTYQPEMVLEDISEHPLSILSQEDVNYLCTIPAGYTLPVFSSVVLAENDMLIEAQREAYRVLCTQKYQMSDGSIRFRHASSDGTEWFFIYTSDLPLESALSPSKETRQISLASPEYGGAGYENAVLLRWNSSDPRDILKLYRTDPESGEKSLLYTTNPFDSSPDDCYYDWPPHEGQFSYEIANTATGSAAFIDFPFRLSPDKTMSAEQSAYFNGSLILTASANPDRYYHNAVKIQWYHASGQPVSLYRVKIPDTALDQRDREVYLGTVASSDTSYHDGLYDWPAHGGVFRYKIVDTGTGNEYTSDICFLSVSPEYTMTSVQKEWQENQVDVLTGSGGVASCMEAYVDTSGGNDTIVWRTLGVEIRNSYVFALAYSDGCLVSSQMKELASSTSASQHPAFSFPHRENVEYKLMILDSSLKPVCPCWESTKHYNYINGAFEMPEW